MSVRRLLAGLFGGTDAPLPEPYSYLAVAHASSPHLTIYKRNGDVFDKLPDPSVLPSSTGYSTSFSPDGNYLAVAHQTAPLVTIYKRNGDAFDKLPDPSVLPPNRGNTVSFSSDGNYLAVAHNTTPFVTIYKRNGDAFDKLPDPSVLPTGTGNGISFSPDGNYLAVAHVTSPYLTIYKRNGDTFDKLPNPSVLPTGTGNGISFSSDGNYLAVAHNTTPFVTIYKRNGDTFDKLPNPSVLPPYSALDSSFSPDGNYLAVAHVTSPFVTIYKRNGDTFDKSPDPSVLPPGIGRSASFSSDGNYLAVAHDTAPYLTIYKRNGDVFDKLPDLSVLPTGNGQGVVFSPLIYPPAPPPPGPPPGLIGVPGQQGFGVGVCPEPEILDELGLSEMEGTTDPTHENYGNYQHTNGGISVFVPKYFYRIGSPESPLYAKYGLNAHDVKGIETFANEYEANQAGYALHRAFIDDGKEKCGFFYDKYLASKDGESSCKSVKNGHPISITTVAGYESSADMTGCTGIIPDSIVIARGRGYRWNVPLLFMVDAIAKISLAHGQAATSDEFCAWFDPNGQTNYPKGCNNTLADFNDPTVTFQAANGSKPLTGSASNLAKTTHNGQVNGITDINGALEQVTLGVTVAGTSATANTAHNGNAAYVFKRDACHADATAGWGGGTDTWGNSSSLVNMYDYFNDIFNWGSSTTSVALGNAENQVFSGDILGVNYLRSCSGIPHLNGQASGAGTSDGTDLFGKDRLTRTKRQNLVAVVAGGNSNAWGAGVFFRNWSYWSNVGGSMLGFRAAAYGSK